MVDQALNEQLARLQAADLIRRARVEAELEYWFKHGLIQETVYGSILRSVRSALHGRVAAAIEQIAAGRPEERATLLALAYDRAGMSEKAFQYAVLAGDHARRTYAHREALEFYGRALALATELDPRRVTPDLQAVYVCRGNVLETAGDHVAAEANYRAMLAFGERRGDPAVQADALNRLVTVQVLAGTSTDLEAQQERALELAQQARDPILIGRALWNRGLALRFRDPLAAVAPWERALELARSSDGPEAKELAASVLLDLLVAMFMMGRFREGLAYAHQAEQAFRALDNRPMVADALGGVAMAYHMSGEPAEARAQAEEGLRISREIGNPWGILYNLGRLWPIELDAGHLERVLAGVNTGLAEVQALGFAVFEGQYLAAGSRAWLELGQFERGLGWASQSRAAFERAGGQAWATWGAGVHGRALLASGDVRGAGLVLEPLWCEGQDVRGWLAGFVSAGAAMAAWALAAGRYDWGLHFCDWFCATFEQEEAWRLVGEQLYFRGRVHLACGELASAEADLLRARELLGRAEVEVLLWCVDSALAVVHVASGQAAQAVRDRSRAVEQVQRLVAGIADRALRASFLARPDVREVMG